MTRETAVDNYKVCDTCKKEKFIPNGSLCAECWAGLASQESKRSEVPGEAARDLMRPIGDR